MVVRVDNSLRNACLAAKPSEVELNLASNTPKWLKEFVENSDVLILTQDEWVTIPHQVRAMMTVMKY